MLKTLSFALSTTMLLLTAGAAAAATLEPVFDVPVASAEFVAFEGIGDLLVFDAPAVGFGFDYAGELFASLTLTFDVANPFATLFGSLALASTDGEILFGSLSGARAGDSLLSLLFVDLQGPLTEVFDAFLRVDLFFFDDLGPNPLTALSDGNSYEVSLTGVPAPIPLPAGAVLLLSALAALAASRRLRAA